MNETHYEIGYNLMIWSKNEIDYGYTNDWKSDYMSGFQNESENGNGCRKDCLNDCMIDCENGYTSGKENDGISEDADEFDFAYDGCESESENGNEILLVCDRDSDVGQGVYEQVFELGSLNYSVI